MALVEGDDDDNVFGGAGLAVLAGFLDLPSRVRSDLGFT